MAGAWVKEPRSAEIISMISVHSAHFAYDQFGKPSVKLNFSKQEMSLYGEYGLYPNLSLVGRFAMQNISLSRQNVLETNEGLGASKVAIKRKLPNFGSWVFSAQIGVSIPGAVENGLDLRLGEGNLEWSIKGLAGRAFTVMDTNGFIDVQVSREFRSNYIPNEWHVDATIGLYPTKKIMTMVQVFSLYGDQAKRAGTRTLSLTRVQGSFVYFLNEKNGVQVYVSTPIFGKNLIADRAFGIAYWRRF